MLKKSLLGALLISAVFISGCAKDSALFDAFSETSQMKRNAANSSWPELTSKFLERFPVGDTFFAGDTKYGESAIYGRTDVPQELIWVKKGIQKSSYESVVEAYLRSDMVASNAYLRAFKEISAELGLSVKTYRNGINRHFLHLMPYYGIGPSSSGKRRIHSNLDDTYIAYDTDGRMRAIFVFYHEFFHGDNGTSHDKLEAMIYFGPLVTNAEHVLNNNVLATYELGK